MTPIFLITFYNLVLWDADRNDAPTRTPQWFNERVRLFESYCLPSVKAQQDKDFVWLVFFDPSTPRNIVERWRSECPHMHPCYCGAAEVRAFADRAIGRNTSFICEAIKRFLPHEATAIVTANLDSDDALHNLFVADLRRAVNADASPRVISFVNGLQYFDGEDIIVGMRYPHNHFLCRVEPSDNFATVHEMSHRMARRLLPIRDIHGEARWIETVHGANVSNELRITSRIRYHGLRGPLSLKPFGLNIVFSSNSLRRGMARFYAKLVKVALWRLRRKIWQRK